MRKFAFAALALAFVAQSASAATVSVTRSTRQATAAEIANDAALAGGKTVFDFFVTTDADILSIDQVVITLDGGTLYQNAAGSDSAPPNPAFVVLVPALGADSWITTPSPNTSIAGGGFANANSSWFDSDNNGPQNNFQFARLTTANTASGTFAFRVNIPNADGSAVVNFPFTLNIPEPASMGMASMGLLALAGFRRRLAA